MAIQNPYFKSEDVHAFPCSYRGYQEQNSTTTVMYDPESRMMTEDNFRNSGFNSFDTYDSYVLEAGATELKVVIGGYYFVIKNYKSYKTDNPTYKYLFISTEEININNDNNYKTTILRNLNSNNKFLDAPVGEEPNIEYYFYGLAMSETVPSGNSTYLQIYDSGVTGEEISNNVKRLKIKVADLNVTDEEIITKTRTQTITGNKTFTNNIVVNSNGAGDQGAATNKVDINVDTEMTKAIIDNAVITDLDVSQSLDATGVATFTNDVIVNGNGAGTGGANTNTVDINVDTTITKANIETLGIDTKLAVGDASHKKDVSIYGDNSSIVDVKTVNAADADIVDADITTADISHLNADVTSGKTITIDGGQLVNKSIVELPGGAGTTTITYSIVIPCYNSIAGVSDYSVLAVVNSALTWVPPYDGSYTLTTS